MAGLTGTEHYCVPHSNTSTCKAVIALSVLCCWMEIVLYIWMRGRRLSGTVLQKRICLVKLHEQVKKKCTPFILYPLSQVRQIPRRHHVSLLMHSDSTTSISFDHLACVFKDLIYWVIDLDWASRIRDTGVISPKLNLTSFVECQSFRERLVQFLTYHAAHPSVRAQISASVQFTTEFAAWRGLATIP
jgi:hypothetical protein